MAKSYTPNYNLTKDDQNEFYNVAVQSGNMDLIDAAMKNLQDNKVEKVEGKDLSTNDYTTEEKQKLASLENYDDTTIQQNLGNHIDSDVNVQDGVHGIRFLNDKLEYFNGSDWIEIKTGGGGLPPNNVSDLNASIGNTEITLTWSDPNDTVIDGQTLVTWKGTKLVRKAGSYPVDETDGVLIIDNQVRNQYASEGFIDSGLTNGVTYYYQAFPYSDQGAVNLNEVNRVSGTPQPFVTYGIRIDMNNSNPETAVVYTDDSIGMTGGSLDWDTKFPFNQIKPCLLQNGVVQYYLDPTDYSKKADGTAADITSGNDGDVMIEVPKMAYMIYTESNYIYVKITDNPNAKAVDSRYCFFAHTRDAEGDKDKLYIGAYLGHTLSSKLRSLSGKAPTASQTIGTFRTQAQANGAGYDQVSFYPLTLLQCLYAIRFKNLDSQTAIGRGYVDGNSAAVNTGGTNTRGMYYGEGTGKQQMKFLGIEDFWGNLRWWIDGLFSNASYNLLTAFKNFNDTGSGYTDRGQGATVNLANYMSKPQGTTERGFIAKEVAGSATTYYADCAYLAASGLPYFGGSWGTASYAGAFCLGVSRSASSSSSGLGGRLMYL